jgi:hypothetical protein
MVQVVDLVMRLQAHRHRDHPGRRHARGVPGQFLAITGPSGAASPLSSASSPGSTGRRPAPSRSMASSSPRWTRTRSPAPPGEDRLRVPGIPPHPDPHCARERLDPARARRRGGCVGQARALLEEVGLKARVDHYPAESCRAASSSASRSRERWRTRPRLLLADEPTGNLDSATGAQIVDLLASLHHRHRDHTDPGNSRPGPRDHAQRIVELRDGRVVETAPRREATGLGRHAGGARAALASRRRSRLA